MKQFSPACERNKQPILEIIYPLFKDLELVLEIGSGTGQHSVFFAEKMSNITWQTSDLKVNHPSIVEWIEDSQLTNVLKPLELDINTFEGAENTFNALFTANTFHIMSLAEVAKVFPLANKIVKKAGVFCIYGPFNYKGEYTSESNKEFDLNFLRQKFPNGGIKNIEDILKFAEQNNFILVEDFAMPSNNRLLYFKKL